MALPTTYLAALILSIVTMLCWGSWANTTKMTGSKWRFELFYYDYSLGVLLCAVVAAVTFGSYGGGDGITFLDNLTIVGRRQLFWVVVGGLVFNVANMLLVAAISVGGMAVAFPIGIGLAVVIGTAWSYTIHPTGNAGMLFGGVGILILAILIAAAAYRGLLMQREIEELQRAAQQGVKGRKPVRQPKWKAIVLSLVSGVFMGSFYPLVEWGRFGDIEMGPYPIGFVFAIAVFLSTPVVNLFFLNLPVEGEPIAFSAYFRGTGRQHCYGVLGGFVWATGTICNFLSASSPPEIHLGPAASYALGQGATLISTLWGLLIWKEFRGAPDRSRTLIYATIPIYAIALGLIAMSPLYSSK